MANSLAEEYEVGNYRCRDCENFSFVMPCGGGCKKRIDHITIEFAVPYFVAAPEGCGFPCSDFKPSPIHVDALKHWNGWADYWEKYVQTWLPYQNENVLVHFTLNGNRSIRYGVPLKFYLYNELFDGGKLRAVEKMYFKSCRPSKENPFSERLIREKIDGIDVQSNNG